MSRLYSNLSKNQRERLQEEVLARVNVGHNAMLAWRRKNPDANAEMVRSYSDHVMSACLAGLPFAQEEISNAPLSQPAGERAWKVRVEGGSSRNPAFAKILLRYVADAEGARHEGSFHKEGAIGVAKQASALGSNLSVRLVDPDGAYWSLNDKGDLVKLMEA